MTVRWPDKVLRIANFAIDLAGRSLAGPSSVNGSSQTVASDAGIWKATLGGVIVKSREEVLCFRAIAAILDGRVNPILVPLCRGYQPVPLGAVAAGLYGEVHHSDGTGFDDGSGYVGQVIDAVLAAPLALRATSASVTVNSARMIEAGQHFSIGERLYRVRTIDGIVGSTASITFRPPLRQPAEAGDRLEFDDPVCRMKLATDGEMDLPLENRRFASPNINLVEDL